MMDGMPERDSVEGMLPMRLGRYIGVLFLSLIVASPVFGQGIELAQPENVGISKERLARLDQVVRSAIEGDEAPGAVVLVARRGKVVYRKAFGHRAQDPDLEMMTADSIFDCASLTKVVATATSVMLLVEEGKLSLADEVVKYIPEFGRRGKSKITLLQLLTHFSGLRPDVDLHYKWEGYDRAIRLACSERLVSPPGKRFIYSDINYFVLGDIVKRVSGMQLDEFCRERIFLPLGMTDTGYKPNPEDPERIVPTESRDKVMLRGEVHDPTAQRMGGVAGHAGLFSTADDLALWGQMILNGGTHNGARLLSPMTVLKMTTPQSPRDKEDWRGLGFDIETRFSTTRGDLFPIGSFGHTGFTGTSLWIDPYSDTLLVLLTSRLHPEGKGDVVSLRQKIASVVAASILDLPLNREHYYYRF
jgi:CubicO group peptidase (beta-lactamase class C family)